MEHKYFVIVNASGSFLCYTSHDIADYDVDFKTNDISDRNICKFYSMIEAENYLKSCKEELIANNSAKIKEVTATYRISD